MPHFKMWYDKPRFKEQDQRDRESPSTLQGPLRGSSSASKDQPPLCSPTGNHSLCLGGGEREREHE